MKVALLNPPGFSPFSPPLALIALSSYLRKAGVDILVIDVSIESLHYYLKPERLSKKILLSKDICNKGNRSLEPLLYEKVKSIESRIDSIETIIYKLWAEERFILDIDSFELQITAINEALLYSSVCHNPTLISINSEHTNDNFNLSKEENPHYDYFVEILIPKLIEFQPDLLGVSYSYSNQVAYGLSMINEVLEKLRVPVVVGGSFFSSRCRNIMEQKSGKFSLKDNLAYSLTPFLNPWAIQGEGEASLLKLCRYIEKNKHISDIPGLVFVDPQRGSVVVNSPAQPLGGKDLPVLELEGLPIGKKYLTPIPQAPLMTSRGCYWNKCTFCSHASVIDSRWREIPSEIIVQNLKLYSDKYGIIFAFFCDEAISPSMLKALSLELPRQDIKIYYGSMARFEKSLIDIIEPASQAGCKFLSFGLESGSPRIISLMNKGYTHETAQTILDKCALNKIIVELHVMFGFPTETMDEAYETIAFMEKNIDKFSAFRVNPWYLMTGSDIFNNMDSYGVYMTKGEYSPFDHTAYSVREGISHGQAVALIEKLTKLPAFSKKLCSPGNFFEDFHILKQLCN